MYLPVEFQFADDRADCNNISVGVVIDNFRPKFDRVSDGHIGK